MTAAAARPDRAVVSLVVAAVSLVAGLMLLQLAAGLLGQRRLDAVEQVSEQRLSSALMVFRPAPVAGRGREVPVAELDPARAVRSVPVHCAPLSLLNTGPAVGGASWTGVGGEPRRPVTTLTVRYPDAKVARDALGEKRRALIRCRSVELTFAPYREPGRTFDVEAGPDALLDAVLPRDRLSYRLVSGDDRYVFYLRRFGNTLTWTYADDPDRATVSRRAVDDLVRRLDVLARQ